MSKHHAVVHHVTHQCGPMPTARRERITTLERMIASWVCGDYSAEEKKTWGGEPELQKWVEARNEEVAHIDSIGHCRLCGYPK